MFYTFSGKRDRDRKKNWNKWLVRKGLCSTTGQTHLTFGSLLTSLFTESQDGQEAEADFFFFPLLGSDDGGEGERSFYLNTLIFLFAN